MPTPGFAEDADHEFTDGVGDGWLCGEAGLGGDENSESDDLGDSIQVPFAGFLKHCEHVEATETGGGDGLVGRYLIGDGANAQKLSVGDGDLTTDDDEIARFLIGEVGGDGVGCGGEFEAELDEIIVN